MPPVPANTAKLTIHHDRKSSTASDDLADGEPPGVRHIPDRTSACQGRTAPRKRLPRCFSGSRPLIASFSGDMKRIPRHEAKRGFVLEAQESFIELPVAANEAFFSLHDRREVRHIPRRADISVHSAEATVSSCSDDHATSEKAKPQGVRHMSVQISACQGRLTSR